MKLLEKIRAALRSPDASSADLRAALAAIDLPPLEAAVVAAERQRAGLLLDGSEAALDKADEILKVAIRERDRAIAAREELTRRLAITEAAETAAAFDVERNAVEQEAAAVEGLLRKRWHELQAEAVALLERLHVAEAAVFEMNNRIAAAGREGRIASIETRVFPAPPHELPAVHSILNRTVLKPVEGAPGWRDMPAAFPMQFGRNDDDSRVGN